MKCRRAKGVSLSFVGSVFGGRRNLDGNLHCTVVKVRNLWLLIQDRWEFPSSLMIPHPRSSSGRIRRNRHHVVSRHPNYGVQKKTRTQFRDKNYKSSLPPKSKTTFGQPGFRQSDMNRQTHSTSVIEKSPGNRLATFTKTS